MWNTLIGESENAYRDSMSHDCINSIIDGGKVIGRGATILNGYSYESPIGGLVIYSPSTLMDGIRSIVSTYVYLENYNTEVGFEECNVSSPERTICDYLMYPDKLHAGLYLLDTLEGYIEEQEYDTLDPSTWELSKVYEMMDYFNIPRETLQPWLEHCFLGE